ncbi:MAG: VOC family protein [Rikenellaceae bacterium]|nr:VOC family protein [Rikenellaceae bacterium]
MEKLIAFFDIPAANFDRAVKFYEKLFSCTIERMECDTEKMGFIAGSSGENIGSISFAENFKPSAQGVLVSFNTENIEKSVTIAETNGGTTIISKTAIQCENGGFFCTILDCEGNRIGLYSKN